MSGMAAFSLKNGVAIALTISNAGTVAGIFFDRCRRPST
jgi:hypothetical protein